MREIRVLIAKPGLDGHDRGAKIVARALQNAGMEVVYTGLHQTPERIVEASIQEDVDIIGLSVLSGAHMTLFQKINDLLDKEGIEDLIIMGGGIIPEEDQRELKEKGLVEELFTPGTPTEDIVEWVKNTVNKKLLRE